jgi:hypothetical protein
MTVGKVGIQTGLHASGCSAGGEGARLGHP